MCIAIHRKQSGELSKKTLWTCWENNPDGAGFMYAEDGKLIVEKGFFKFKEFWKAVRPHILTFNRELVLHFRIATSGKVDYDNCHPHFIHDGLAYVHNGIISELNDSKDVCDTIRFANILKELPLDFINSKGIMSMIEMAIGHNKLVFMDANGVVKYINEELGVESKGVWYSNTGFRYARGFYASSYKDDYDYGGTWERGTYSHGFASCATRQSYSEPIVKERALSVAEEPDDYNLDELPASATFDTYQRYDNDFDPSGSAAEMDDSGYEPWLEDEYGFSEYDYAMLAEEEVYWWRDHPEYLSKSAYADIMALELTEGKLRFQLQEWLDTYSPDYDKILRDNRQSVVIQTKTYQDPIKEVVNATTEKLTNPIQLSLTTPDKV